MGSGIFPTGSSLPPAVAGGRGQLQNARSGDVFPSFPGSNSRQLPGQPRENADLLLQPPNRRPEGVVPGKPMPHQLRGPGNPLEGGSDGRPAEGRAAGSGLRNGVPGDLLPRPWFNRFPRVPNAALHSADNFRRDGKTRDSLSGNTRESRKFPTRRRGRRPARRLQGRRGEGLPLEGAFGGREPRLDPPPEPAEGPGPRPDSAGFFWRSSATRSPRDRVAAEPGKSGVTTRNTGDHRPRACGPGGRRNPPRISRTPEGKRGSDSPGRARCPP